MKVMCIAQTKPNQISGHKIDIKVPVFGDVLVVAGVHDYNGEKYYSFDEYGPTVWFQAKYFVPVDDVDETELIKEKELIEA